MENRDIIFFDLETTGVNASKDRIVSIAALKCDAALNVLGEIKYYLVNPEMAIPKDASDVHGITDEMVKEQPTFKQLSKGMFNFFVGCDLGGFNSNKFDIPMLIEEFARVGLELNLDDISFIDVMVIYHENEKRDLKAAALFYLDAILIDAHNAKADILATYEIFKAQIQRYGLQDKTIKEIDSEYGGALRVDLAGTIILDENGTAVYNMGKDKGKSVVQFPSFARDWMLRQDFITNQTKQVIRKLLKLV